MESNPTITVENYQARKMLCSAADYLYRNQMGDAGRVQAMDMLDRNVR